MYMYVHFRNGHCLRPKVFYELTDGCELILANLPCKYYKEAPPIRLESVPQSIIEKISYSSGYSDETVDYEVDQEVLAAASPQENVPCQKKTEQDTNVDRVVLETQASWCSFPLHISLNTCCCVDPFYPPPKKGFKHLCLANFTQRRHKICVNCVSQLHVPVVECGEKLL